MVPYLRLNIGCSATGTSPGAAEIVAFIQSDVASGSLHAGGRLPPVRVLAHHLGVSKNTVAAAYDELVARGVLESRPREGFWVACAGERTPTGGAPPQDFSLPDSQLLSPKLTMDSKLAPDTIALDSVFVAPELLPRQQITDCVRSVLNTPGLHTFYDAQGYLPLRQSIADRLVARGIPAQAEHVIITTGSQQALDIVCRALKKKRIATESPAYLIGKRLFEMNGMQVRGLPFDPFDGVDCPLWTQLLERAHPSLLYLTTNFQNPTG